MIAKYCARSGSDSFARGPLEESRRLPSRERESPSRRAKADGVREGGKGEYEDLIRPLPF